MGAAISIIKKQMIYDTISDRMFKLYPRPQRLCLHWAKEVCRELHKYGLRTIIQAGDCSWPMIDEDQDDGVRNTHMSYVWTGKYERDLSMGQLPEIHVWAAIPATNEIIDMTTKFWPELCPQMTGSKWEGLPPPDYLWCKADELPKRVLYRPIAGATFFASRAAALI